MTTFGDAMKPEDYDPPDGPITATIVDTEARKTRSAAAKPLAVVVLQVANGPDAGRRFDHEMWLTGQGLFYAKEALIGYGIDPAHLAPIDVEVERDLDVLAALMKSLIGHEADVRIKHWSDTKFNVYVDLVRTGRSADTPQAPPKPPDSPDRGFGDEAPF